MQCNKLYIQKCKLMRYEFRKCRGCLLNFLWNLSFFLCSHSWNLRSQIEKPENIKYARQSTAKWFLIDRINWSKTNIKSSLPIWSTSSIQEVKKFDCWTPSIRIRVSWTDSHCWKGQFFYGISQCLEYCNNGAVIPCYKTKI